ncbi:hypothetical protein [Virgibacillus ainsalahensis]
MENIQKVLEDNVNLELIRLYAIGTKNKDRFYKGGSLMENNDSYILSFGQLASLNTWSQGNKKVSIHKETGIVSVYNYDIDGESWSNGSYSLEPSLTIEMDALLVKMEPLRSEISWLS